ncbi:hypothetical protein WJX84_000419 [Apatococcus fuscideae]|uniref:Kinesin motor domain-containing protein n=1 Tax=Apatococcus fuscideae TaxID=2026836 RepID=A0AAW1T4R1_9CHLO
MIRALRESSPRRPLSREVVTDGSPPKRQQAGGSRESIWVGVRIRPASELEDDPERGTVVDGAIEEGISSVEQLSQLLHIIEERRMVRDTKQNSESSRSHQVVRIYIESRPVREAEGVDGEMAGVVDDSEDMRPVKMSALTFVDLAGSERMNQLDRDDSSQRARQTEGSSINKSLLTLGIVIRVLGDGKGHIPFRDSKLTRLLQPSLGGNSRTAIIVTISPASGASDNTQAALFFANAAKRVTMQPRVNEIVRDKALLRHLQTEIISLRKQLSMSRGSQVLGYSQPSGMGFQSSGRIASPAESTGRSQHLAGSQEERVLGEALQQTEESGIAALEERLARRGESGSLAEAETALTSLLQKLSLKPLRDGSLGSIASEGGSESAFVSPCSDPALSTISGVLRFCSQIKDDPSSSPLLDSPVLNLQTDKENSPERVSKRHAWATQGSQGSRPGRYASNNASMATAPYTGSRQGSQSHWHPDGGAQQSGKSDSAVMLQGYKSGMSALRDSVVKEVAALKRALDDQAEFAAKLDCQKQLLVQHVLRLEDKALGLEGRAKTAEMARSSAEKQLITLQAQADALKQEVLKAKHAAALAEQRVRAAEDAKQKLAATHRAPVAAISTASTASGGLRSPQSVATSPAVPLTPHGGPQDNFRTPGQLRGLSIHRPTPSDSSPDQDSWAAPPSIETLMPKIVALWEELFVPLVHRSRWFLAFRGSEVFYYETEHRRLQHLRTQMGVSSADDGSPESKQKAEKFLEKAQRKLEWERRFLASQLKVEYSSEERDELFLKWNIYRDSKERKLQLVRQLWTANRQDPADMQEFSEMVIRLNGTEVSDGYDLVFAKSDGDSWMKSMLASSGRVMGPVLHRVVTAPQALKPVTGASTPSRSDSLRPGERPRSFLSSIGLGNITPIRRNPSITSTASGGWNQDPDTPQSAATPKSQAFFSSFTKRHAGKKPQDR